MEYVEKKQGRIHGYLSRVRLGGGSNESLQASKQENTQSKMYEGGYMAKPHTATPRYGKRDTLLHENHDSKEVKRILHMLVRLLPSWLYYGPLAFEPEQ